jgi:hypothetical protein
MLNRPAAELNFRLSTIDHFATIRRLKCHPIEPFQQENFAHVAKHR